VYSDVPDTLGCGRYFRAAISKSVVTPVRIDWADASSLVVEVDSGQLLRWSLDLAVSSATSAFNALAGRVPLQGLIGLALRAGRFRLVDGLAEGFKFRVLPQALWIVADSRAVLEGRDLGVMAPSGPRGSIFAAGALIVEVNHESVRDRT
jgi:hypothetical protein